MMSKKKLLFALLFIGIVLLSAGCLRKKAQSGPVSLTVYGLDSSDVWQDIMTSYKAKRPNVSLKYKKFADPDAFENLIVNEIAEGEGPDIFYLHNTWLPRHAKKLVPLTSETLTPQNMSETFVGTAAEDFVQPDPKDGASKIYALPLYVDTLALYYNKEMFEQKIPERGKPAETWTEFKEDAAKLRVQSEDGKLSVGAIALGRADNIKLAADILYHLFLQSGVSMYDDTFKSVQLGGAGGEAFSFFTSFAESNQKNFSWSNDLVAPQTELGEVEAFLAGKTASVLGYSDLYPRLETELKNVKSRLTSAVSLNQIGVAPSPQMSSDEASKKAWASYYGLAVSRNSKASNFAWDFIQFAASKANSDAYHKKTKRPAARRDLIEAQKKEPVTEIFVSQVGYAGSYRIFSPQKFSEILKDAVSAVNSGQSPRQSFSEAVEKMSSILKTEAPDGLYPKPKLKPKKK